MPDPIFDDLTDVYEAMIDWPRRLAHEQPWYRRLFEQVGARSVVDVACGTGRHAAMFASWGLRVEAADISPRMIERARAAATDRQNPRWVVRSFDEPIPAQPPFDVAVCTGNSLALAPDAATAGRAIQRMMQSVRAGGCIVVHLLNLWRLPDGPCIWQKCQRAALPQGDVLITKGVHRRGDRGYVELLVAPLESPSDLQSESVPLLGLEPEWLERVALDSGAASATFCGGYRDEPYDRRQSMDLILVTEKSPRSCGGDTEGFSYR